MNKLFVGTLVAALLLRFFLLIWAITYPLDVNGDQMRYVDWAQSAHMTGLAKTYEDAYVHTIHNFPTIPNNQPPGTLYIVSATYEGYIIVGKIINKLTDTASGSLNWVNTYLLHSLMRVPNLFADIALGLLLYLMVRKENGSRRGVLAASLVWFNPVVIYNSTFWGQMDGMVNAFFMLALFLAFKKKYIIAIIAFACSLFIKLSLLPLFPFFLIFLYFHSGKQWKPLVSGLVLAAGGIVVATLPISQDPIGWLVGHWAMFSRGEAQNITSAAFNFWWMLTCLPTYCPHTLQSYDTFVGIPIEVYAYVLFAATVLPILYLQITKPKLLTQKHAVFLAFALVALAVFLFMPRMHDRYMYPFFPLFAGAIATSKIMKHYVIILAALTVLHFLNLISSWYPTRFLIDLYQAITFNNYFTWSVATLTVLIGIAVYIIAFNSFIAAKKK